MLCPSGHDAHVQAYNMLGHPWYTLCHVLTMTLIPRGPQAKIARAQAAREHQQRKRNLTKYIPNAAGAIWTVLSNMAATQPHGPKRRRLQDQSDVLAQVQRKEVSQGWAPGRQMYPRRW
jgi:hypothetical protein